MATSYISYLTRALETDDTPGTFKAELGNLSRKSSNCSSNSQHSNMNNNDINLSSSHGSPKSDSSVSFKCIFKYRHHCKKYIFSRYRGKKDYILRIFLLEKLLFVILFMMP